MVPRLKAEASPRVPIRRMTLTFGRSSDSTTCHVLSGESSSTTMISMASGASARSDLTVVSIESRSLYVARTMEIIVWRAAGLPARAWVPRPRFQRLGAESDLVGRQTEPGWPVKPPASQVRPHGAVAAAVREPGIGARHGGPA